MRIWLLGNGRSLLETPLELLKGEQVMGVNKIGHLTKDLTHYVKIDYSPFDSGRWQDELEPFAGKIPCLLWDMFKDGEKNPKAPFGSLIQEGIGETDKVTWVSRCSHHGWGGEWHDLCTGYNSILAMCIWAVQLGFTEIYLLGCDLNFTDGKTDHFMNYYERVDKEYKERNNGFAMKAHEVIKEFCPVPVYNATYGGGLELYPRVNMVEVLRG